nr:branched-chain amino acid ABC transporter permease [Azoarcus taiwanensis]
MAGQRRVVISALVLAWVGWAAVVWLGVDFALSQLVLVCTYAIAGLGVVLIVGQSGQISLGQGALLALGAYAQALLTARGVPAPLALVIAIGLGAAGGWIASLPARRLGGLYFAMSTLAFALIVEEGLVRWEGLTRGNAGMLVPDFALGGWAAVSPASQALVAVTALALAWWCCHRWVRSHHGLAWRSVRDDEVAAAACGVDVGRSKARAFVVGGGLSGLAGGLYAHFIGFISPEQFGLFLSFELLMLAFIGGSRHLAGAFWGALVIVAIPQFNALLRDLLPAAIVRPAGLEAIMFGLVIVAVILLRPQGIAGGAKLPR